MLIHLADREANINDHLCYHVGFPHDRLVRNEKTVFVAGLVVIILAGVLIFLLVSSVDSLPRPFLRIFGYLLLGGGTIELLLLFWVLGYVAVTDWSLWGLSLDTFWREQLSAIYFVKEWLYTWLWNDLLNLVLVFLPAIVFLALRTTITTVLGMWALAASRK
jgi:hypothetical protein